MEAQGRRRLVRLDLNVVKRRQKYVRLGFDALEVGELLSVLGEVTAIEFTFIVKIVLWSTRRPLLRIRTAQKEAQKLKLLFFFSK